MDYLWTPWRFRYVSEAIRSANCVFCEMAGADPGDDSARFILYRARFNFVFLNVFPYTTGHTLIAPYTHNANLGDLDDGVLSEMIMLARKLEQALAAGYHAEGYNLGMNLGKCAGAGVPDHLHLHFLPRWTGDTNFMSVTAETRVLPEDLRATYDKLAGFFRA